MEMRTIGPSTCDPPRARDQPHAAAATTATATTTRSAFLPMPIRQVYHCRMRVPGDGSAAQPSRAARELVAQPFRAARDTSRAKALRYGAGVALALAALAAACGGGSGGGSTTTTPPPATGGGTTSTNPCVTIGNTRSLPRLTERPFSGPAPDTAAGFSKQAIASQLFLSEHTVHRHVANMNHFA